MFKTDLVNRESGNKKRSMKTGQWGLSFEVAAEKIVENGQVSSNITLINLVNMAKTNRPVFPFLTRSASAIPITLW